jgi:16S rRNA (cytosine1402-N4)-methyltransferase
MQATVFHGQNASTERRVPAHRGDAFSSAGRPDGSNEKTARSEGTMTSSGSKAVADGKPVADSIARHTPVLARQAVGWLGIHDGGLYVDATFGAGGYTRAMLEMPGAQVIGIDRDQSAIARGADLVQEARGRLELIEQCFSNLASAVGDSTADGIVFDLGVSSMQLDEAGRGFSFRLDGPLDMRMTRAGPSAADVVARASERDLAAIIARLGEEHHARAIARAIVKARSVNAIATTGALADIVARVVHARDGAIHPATRTFQALRILVNDELGELAHGLAAAERALKPAGRLVVVAFHSLEDRIVKTFLTERSRAPAGSRHRPEFVAPPPTFRVLTRRPEAPDDAEIAANPRARSAKLRAAERTAAAARSTEVDHLLPRLPSLAEVLRGRP